MCGRKPLRPRGDPNGKLPGRRRRKEKNGGSGSRGKAKRLEKASRRRIKFYLLLKDPGPENKEREIQIRICCKQIKYGFWGAICQGPKQLAERCYTVSMGVEQFGGASEPLNEPEALLQLKAQLFDTWRQLPGEHQATIALALVDGVMAGEQGPWMREALALQWPPHANPPMELATFRPENEPPAAEESASPFDAWMQQADQFVYGTAGCSIHDLPDCDYYNMWRDGLPPAEAADTALTEAGFDRFG